MLTFDPIGCELLLYKVFFQAHWSSSLLTLQAVSHCCLQFFFKPDNQAWHWFYTVGCELLLCCFWFLFKLADKTHPWLCSLWVAQTISSSLTKHTLDSTGCEFLLTLALPQAHWSGSPLTLQFVSTVIPGVCLALSQTHWSHLLLTLQNVSCCCLWFLFKLDEQAWPWLYRKWVTAVTDHYWFSFKATDQTHPWLCSWWAAVSDTSQAC